MFSSPGLIYRNTSLMLAVGSFLLGYVCNLGKIFRALAIIRNLQTLHFQNK